MIRTIYPAAISCSVFVALLGATPVSAAGDHDAISTAIKAQVREIITGINAHNAAMATMHDAPNVVVIESGQPNTVGAAADLAGFKQAFAAAPSWKVSLVEEAVDVPASGEMAIYRSVYNQDSMHDNVPFTQKVNFIAGWSRHQSGTWMMDWYAVSDMEKSHKK